MCWGNNDDGAVGDGTTTDALVPASVVGLNANVVDVGLGKLAACAQTSAGAVSCWGGNGRGQLGNGTTTPRSTPLEVSGLP
jgi:alpha-tubulin suppressor-like RCC1 family protein